MFSKSTLANKPVRLGNYRKEETWSKEAKRFKLQGEDRRKAIHSLENTLVDDVYLCSQPYIASISIPLDKSMMDLMRNEIKKILIEYGDRDILFVSKNASIPSFLARNATELSPRIFLEDENCSMPLNEFLLCYKGNFEIPSDIIEEWSGLSSRQQVTAYEEIVKFVRRKLDQYTQDYYQQMAMSS